MALAAVLVAVEAAAVAAALVWASVAQRRRWRLTGA